MKKTSKTFIVTDDTITKIKAIQEKMQESAGALVNVTQGQVIERAINMLYDESMKESA